MKDCHRLFSHRVTLNLLTTLNQNIMRKFILSLAAFLPLFALNNLLMPNGGSSRVVWDLTLYSEDGQILEEIPFMMLYDEDYSPAL